MTAGHRRLVEAVVDARDCLTRAAALYAQFWNDAPFPTQGGDRITAPGKPESRPPSPGDVAARSTLTLTIRNVSRCVAVLSGLAAVEPPRLPLVPGAAPSAVAAHCQFADVVFAWVLREAEAEDGQLDGNTIRRIHHAAASARAALTVWDTPPATDALQRSEPGSWAHARASKAARDEHGTAVRPPSHYPAGTRCRTCGWRVPEPNRRECETCRKQKQRELEAEVKRARRAHRSAVRWDGVKGEHTAAAFDDCACDPRQQRKQRTRTRRRSA